MGRGMNFLVFLVIGVFILLEFNAFRYIRRLKDGAEIRVFLASDADIEGVRKELEKREGVAEVIFVSKDYALREFKKGFKMSGFFLSGGDRNPLPASFRVVLDAKYKNPRYLGYFGASVERVKGVKKFVYPKEYIQNICIVRTYLTRISYGVCGLLFFLTLTVIATSLNREALILKNEREVLQRLGVPRGKLKIRLSGQVFMENLVLSGVAMGVVYCGYRFLLIKAFSGAVFLPSILIFGFIGGCGLLSFIIAILRKV